jgi:hypothetical protein
MYGSAGGPLGALLMIVPLAAIPVFAIVGVPQFAPVAASPSDDDEISDLGDPQSSSSPSATEGPARGRSAEDLFAPLPATSSPPAPREPRRAAGKQDAGPPALPGRPQNATRTLPPSEALDQWEIRPASPDAFDRPGERASPPKAGASPEAVGDTSEVLEIPTADPAEGRVSAAGFSGDLLTPERTSRPRKQPENRRAESIENAMGPPDSLAEHMSEQSGWKAAARRLKELGIRKYRLESQIEEQTFAFICTFSSRDNPRVVRRFEAVADNPLEAVQKVLEQIDESE